MKTISMALFCLVLGSLLFAPTLFAKSFGAPLTLQNETAVSHILDDPESYVGKTLRVKGLVVDVCALRGCWIDIASDRPFEKLHVKVDDGAIVIPMSARGKIAVVEGVWQKIIRANEFGFARERPSIERPLDPTERSTTDTFYQLRATGLAIEGL